jgi:hypothetical protein
MARLEGLGKLKELNDLMGTRTRDLPICSIAHQPTTLQRDHFKIMYTYTSASELYQPSDHRLSAKLVPTFEDRGVSHGQRNGSLRPCFLDRFKIMWQTISKKDCSKRRLIGP